ncbi:MAG: DUF6879 family protein [Pseudonocardiaceae bacterium]
MGGKLTDEQFDELFETYRYTARRLEPRDCYHTETSTEPRRRYQAGELSNYTFMDRWTGKVSRWSAQGKRMVRVRVITEPLTEDARYLLHIAQLNAAAGEEIRYLPRQRAQELELGLPDEDYWIFDATTAAIIHFDEEDRPVGQELIDDPAEIVRRLHWFDAAWHHSISREEFAAKHGVE